MKKAPAKVKRKIFYIGKTDRDVRQHMVITTTMSQSDPLITRW